MALDSAPGDMDLVPAPDEALVRRPLGRRWLLAMILVGAGLFVSFGPVDATTQLEHAIQDLMPTVEGGCGGG